MSEPEKCPACGTTIAEPDEEQILTCPSCGTEGSTACCMTGGVGVQCAACEQSENDEEGYDLDDEEDDDDYDDDADDDDD